MTPSRLVAAACALAMLSCMSASAAGDPGGPRARGADANVGPTVPVAGLAVQASHPRLFWTPGRIALAKKWAEKASFSPGDSDWAAQAFDHVVRGGDCSRAVAWAMGVNLNGDSVACDQCRWLGEDALLVWDWCHDQMSASQRSTFTSNFNAWLTHWSRQDWGGTKESFEQNNYFWGYLRNELEFGLASHPENAAAAEALLNDALVNRFQKRFVPAAQTTSRGGVPQEGSQYGNYLLGYAVIPFQTAAIARRDLWSETNFYKEAVFYLVYTTLWQKTTSSCSPASYSIFPFGEDETFCNGSSAATRDFGDFMMAAANRWWNTAVGASARRWLNTVQPKLSPWQAAVDDGGDAIDTATLPLDYYAPGPQYLWAHSGSPWSAATTLFIQMGAPTSAAHTNRDPGAFQIWRGGRWLSRQTVGYVNAIPGYGGSGAVDTQDSLGHNSLLVNGMGVSTAYPDRTRGAPVVRRLQSQPGFTYADVDLTPVYRSSVAKGDNPAAVHVEREYIFVRPLQALVVFDRLQSDTAARTKTFLLHAETSPTVDGANRVVTITSGSQALRASILVPSSPSLRVVDERPGSKGTGQFRVEVDTSGAAQSYFLTVLQAKDASAPALDATVSGDASSFTVALGSAASVKLEAGATSSGGSITIGGSTTSFRSDVQGISVGDGGPVWAR